MQAAENVVSIGFSDKSFLFRLNGTLDHDEKILFDPFCDPDSPVIVTCEKVEDAAEKIRGGIVRTPCTVS